MAINIDGNGLITLGGTASTQGRVRLSEDTDNGTNYIELTAPASVASDRTITFPDATGTVVISGTTPSLNGITFPATQVASADANTLDDYEEGIWTPTVSSGYTSISYNNQHGWYVKVGLLAVISCRVQFSGTANAGNIIIAGLPFTQGTLGGGAYGGGGIPYATVAAITGTSPYVGDNTVQFFTTGTGTQITSGATNVTSQWISFVVSISVA
jgi:hypothetical protein